MSIEFYDRHYNDICLNIMDLNVCGFLSYNTDLSNGTAAVKGVLDKESSKKKLVKFRT